VPIFTEGIGFVACDGHDSTSYVLHFTPNCPPPHRLSATKAGVAHPKILERRNRGAGRLSIPAIGRARAFRRDGAAKPRRVAAGKPHLKSCFGSPPHEHLHSLPSCPMKRPHGGVIPHRAPSDTAYPPYGAVRTPTSAARGLSVPPISRSRHKGVGEGDVGGPKQQISAPSAESDA